MLRLVMAGLCLSLLLACSSDGGAGNEDATWTGNDNGQFDFGGPQEELTGTGDIRIPQDSSAGYDQQAKVDLAPVDTGPLPTGDKAMGEMCLQDAECESGLCWASDKGTGCTVECTAHAGCQAFGLVCMPRADGVAVCALPPSVGANCGNHGECMYPTSCLEEFSWCDLPECTWDGDCPAGQECEAGVRKCQSTTCNSTYECKNPARFCLDGQCLPPQCTSTAQCPEGQICSFAQGICTAGTPCNEEGKCAYYNQLCVDGLCEPNLCTNPCSNPAYQCNHKSGKCGAVCESDSGCPAAQGCDLDVGICYENLPPMADPRVLVDSQLMSGATVMNGDTITLDGTLSQDPEGFPLTYRWMVLSKPPGSPVNAGTVFCQEATCELKLTKGVFIVGLWVEDAVGVTSIQSAIGVVAK